MYTDIKPILKKIMSEKGVTYRALGQKIGISESGVKKFFQADDCSLSRLEQIAAVLETDVLNLLAQAKEGTELQEIEIDPKTQRQLEKHPQLIHLYWLLLVEEMSPDEILNRYGISKSALYKGLSELDRLKLIFWKVGDRISVIGERPFVVKPSGPLVKYWIRQFSDSILGDFEQSDAPNEDLLLTQRFLYLKKQSIKDLKRRLEELVRDFGEISLKEKRLGKGRTTGVRLHVSYAVGSVVSDLSKLKSST